MRINNNLAALNAWRNLSVNSDNLQKSLERLSSGYRINKAADDAAGLAVSEKMKAQIRGLSMAERNTQDGISLLQTAEGGAAKIQDMLQRMRELAVQSASGSLEDADRAQLQLEFEELAKEINRTAKTITFNNQSLIMGDEEAKSTVSATVLLDNGYDLSVTYTYTEPTKGEEGNTTPGTTVPQSGIYQVKLEKSTNDEWTASLYNVAGETATALDPSTYGITVTFDTSNAPSTATELDAGVIAISRDKSYKIQVGANEGESVNFQLSDLTGRALGITKDTNDTTANLVDHVSISNSDDATSTITTLDRALSLVTSARAKMGAYQNRLEATVDTLETQYENLTAAESRIRDVDMAQEMANFTKYQILQQAGTAMLAQANQLPQSILSLLR